MKKFWGPLGWLTLHSVSLIYPEKPSGLDRTVAHQFLELFGDTISCNDCKQHFLSLKKFYIDLHPDFLDSRQNFALFVFRAHNTVNFRIDKPRPATVAECIASLRNATSQVSLTQFRNSYLSYLNQNWGREITGDGFILRGKVRDMIRINNEYWNPKDIPIPDLEEEDVLALIDKPGYRLAPSGIISSVMVGFKGGRLRLMRK
jgi:hypothetical protein